MRGALLVAGITSDVCKSVLVAGLCRWLARQGVSTAPFKAQDMSLNSCRRPLADTRACLVIHDRLASKRTDVPQMACL